MTAKKAKHLWEFRARFRKGAFGWRSQPAVTRVREAVTEISAAARKDPVLGAEGAILFLEKVSGALEHVDGSSGSIGTAVNNAIAALVPVIASAPADDVTRNRWLERLFEAHRKDDIPYIESLAETWGELCVSRDLAAEWADRLLPTTRMTLRAATPRGHFHGTSACLSALYAAERHEDLIDLLKDETFWPYKRWAAKALLAQGKKSEALALAEGSRSPWASDLDIDRLCEEILLSSGLAEEAYRRYGLRANRASTYVAWFRALAAKYPQKRASELLQDLVAAAPGEEGKWFAAAKDAGLFDEAIALANRTPCSPQTLTRAARDFEKKNPAFALEAGLAALHWLAEGYGYEVTGADVWKAYSHTMKAAENAGCAEQVRGRIRDAIAGKPASGWVIEILELALRT